MKAILVAAVLFPVIYFALGELTDLATKFEAKQCKYKELHINFPLNEEFRSFQDVINAHKQKRIDELI